MSIKESNYRKKIGFTNQQNLKRFFKGLDCSTINYKTITNYNKRLEEIIKKLDSIVPKCFRNFKITKKIESTYKKIKKEDILPKLNDQGRSPEQVYYSWMRGYLVCEYFKKAFAHIFKINEKRIIKIGRKDFYLSKIPIVKNKRQKYCRRT